MFVRHTGDGRPIIKQAILRQKRCFGCVRAPFFFSAFFYAPFFWLSPIFSYTSYGSRSLHYSTDFPAISGSTAEISRCRDMRDLLIFLSGLCIDLIAFECIFRISSGEYHHAFSWNSCCEFDAGGPGHLYIQKYEVNLIA